MENLFAKEGTVKNTSIIQIISRTKKLMIKALDGKAYIYADEDVFNSYTEKLFFELWGLNQPGLATTETPVEVSEVVKHASFAQIFTGINPDLDRLVLTQAQIIAFCKKHSAWLSQQGNTFFLTKAGQEYYVISVDVMGPGILGAEVRALEDDDLWNGEDKHRVVYPKLIPFGNKNF